jgi:hypothetical protein
MVVRGGDGRDMCLVECGVPKLVIDRGVWLNAQMMSCNPSGGTGACATAEWVVSLRCLTVASSPLDYILVGRMPFELGAHGPDHVPTSPPSRAWAGRGNRWEIRVGFQHYPRMVPWVERAIPAYDKASRLRAVRRVRGQAHAPGQCI